MRGLKQSLSLTLALGAMVPVTDAWAQAVDSGRTLEEVVVTAQKVKQRAIDVPVAVTAVQGSTLVNQDLVQVTD